MEIVDPVVVIETLLEAPVEVIPEPARLIVNQSPRSMLVTFALRIKFKVEVTVSVPANVIVPLLPVIAVVPEAMTVVVSPAPKVPSAL